MRRRFALCLAVLLGGCSFFKDLDGLEGTPGSASGAGDAAPSSSSGGSSTSSSSGSGSVGDSGAPHDAGGDAAFDAGESNPYRLAVLADRPVAYYPLDEAGGSVVHDYLGNHDAVLGGPVTLGEPGVSGTGAAVAANVSDALLDTGWDFSLPGATPYAFELWVQPQLTNSFAYLVDHREDSGVGYGLKLYDNGEIMWEQVSAGGASRQARTPARTFDGYVHVAVSYDGTTIALYVGGVSSDQLSYTPGEMTTTARVLRFARLFQGRIDEIAVYDHPLGAARVVAHIDAAQP